MDVYWAIFTEPNKFAEKALLSYPPVNLIEDLKDIYAKESGVFSCPAVFNKHKNTFVYRSPFDISVTTMGGQGFYSSYDNVSQRSPMYKNGFSFDIDCQIIFYSFDDLEMQTSPPYFHQTSYSYFGHSPSGQFNISKWFRPSSPNISCFSGSTFFKLNKGEPIMYYYFLNNKKINLKQFVMTEKLFDIALASVNHKKFSLRQDLESLYKKFENAKFKKIIKEEILNNLLD